MHGDSRANRGQPISVDERIQGEILVEFSCQLFGRYGITGAGQGEGSDGLHIAVGGEFDCGLGIGAGLLQVAEFRFA